MWLGSASISLHVSSQLQNGLISVSKACMHDLFSLDK